MKPQYTCRLETIKRERESQHTESPHFRQMDYKIYHCENVFLFPLDTGICIRVRGRSYLKTIRVMSFFFERCHIVVLRYSCYINMFTYRQYNASARISRCICGWICPWLTEHTRRSTHEHRNYAESANPEDTINLADDSRKKEHDWSFCHWLTNATPQSK